MSFALHAMPRASLLSVVVSAALIAFFSASDTPAAEPATNDPETLGAVEVEDPLQHNANNLFDHENFPGNHQHVTDRNQPGAPRTLLATFRIDY